MSEEHCGNYCKSFVTVFYTSVSFISCGLISVIRSYLWSKPFAQQSIIVKIFRDVGLFQMVLNTSVAFLFVPFVFDLYSVPQFGDNLKILMTTFVDFVRLQFILCLLIASILRLIVVLREQEISIVSFLGTEDEAHSLIHFTQLTLGACNSIFLTYNEIYPLIYYSMSWEKQQLPIYSVITNTIQSVLLLVIILIQNINLIWKWASNYFV